MFVIDIDRKILHHVPDRQSDSQTAGQPDESRTQMFSVYVSPLGLGAMSIGDQWQAIGMGAMEKDSSFKLLDAYFNAGGNFIDTANI